MKIFSRNINGIRAIVKKDFVQIIKTINPDIICLQEVKSFESQIPADLRILFSEYNYIWHNGQRAGYAGTAILYKKNLAVKAVENNLENFEILNSDGRITQIEFDFLGENVVLVNSYFPNGGTRADGTEMLTYKLKFYDEFIFYLKQLINSGKNVIACGDFNVVHTEIDIARPKENQNSIGFLPVEREKISELLKNGFVDVFRYFYPEQKNKYTWRSYRARARERNVGRRIDYFFVNQKFIDKIKSIQHLENIYGSDHCPILLEL